MWIPTSINTIFDSAIADFKMFGPLFKRFSLAVYRCFFVFKSEWRSKGFYWIPTILRYSLINLIIIDLKMIAPLRERPFKSVNIYHVICTNIVHLLFWCFPSAIFGAISFIIINAPKRMSFCRSRSHIFIKIFERMVPTLAYLYPSRSISIIRLVCFSITSGYHRMIRIMFWCSGHIVGCPHLFTILCSHFFSKATARFSATLAKLRRHYNAFISTIANAIPARFSIFVGVTKGFNNETAISKASEIKLFWHGILQAGCKRLLKVVAGRSAWIPAGELPLATTDVDYMNEVSNTIHIWR